MSTLRAFKYSFVSILLFSVVMISFAETQARLMPLGNSITEGTGSSHDGGYRRDLYYLLQNAGIAFDFVGSLQYGNGFPDIDHEGHPGFLADQLNVQTYLANHPADVVFLEIGTNDISYGENAAQVRDDIERAIADIFNVNQTIAVYLSTVIPRQDSNALQQVTDDLNALLPDLTQTKAAAGYKIYLVDIAARIKADPSWKTNLMTDNLHPNDAGYALMASTWFDAYVSNLPARDAIFADDFNSGGLDANKWLRGNNGGNAVSVTGNVLEIKSDNAESGWVITRNAYAARNTAVSVKVVQPNNDGNLGISPAYNLASPYGVYDQANWYRFYVYRSGNSGPYRLFAAWKKNGVDDGLDVTGNLVITGAIYLRLRCDDSVIHFDASFDGATWSEAYNETFALPGYTPDSNFYYELAAYNTDLRGALAVDDFSIKAATSGTDTQAPQISAMAAQNLTPSSAQILWQTNEPADSQVEYGVTASYGAMSPLEPALVAAHAVSLSNLQANTTYHYRVRSKDAAGNLATSGDFTFTTASATNALFADDFNASNLDNNKWLKGANAGNNTAVANNALDLKSQGAESGWVITRQAYAARNTFAAVKVINPNDDGNLGISPTYNLSSKYGIYDQANWYRFYAYRNGHTGPYRLYVEWNKNGVNNGFDVTGNLVIAPQSGVYLRLRFDHSKIYFEASLDGTSWTDTYHEIFGLPGWTLDTPFYYELAAYNTGSNGVLTADDFSIGIPPGGTDTQPPVIGSVAAQNITNSSAQISWQTDEPADSQVEYGLTTSYGEATPVAAPAVTAHNVALANLQANTLYHYRVKSKDANGNLALSDDLTFTTLPPSTTIFVDDFNAGSLDGSKWQKGVNSGNKSAVKNNALELKSQGAESGWVITRNAYSARNTTVAVKVTKPNNDGNLGLSPTYNLSSKYGIYDQANWYRFYVYRTGNTGPYRLYVDWKKNGVENGFDVTGALVVSDAVYLRLRFDNSTIHFEASLDGASWSDTYAETFDLPGYTLDTPFYYELAGYKTNTTGVITVDDFSINSNAATSLASKLASLETVSKQIPATFTLENYPNPFNAATRLKFSLPRSAEIQLAVFDARGREVRELIAAWRPAGNYETVWNGRNRAGEELSSGVYFVRLRYRLAGSNASSQMVRRVMMVK